MTFRTNRFFRSTHTENPKKLSEKRWILEFLFFLMGEKRKRLWNEEDVEEGALAAEKARKSDERKRSRRAKKRKLAEEAADELEKKVAASPVIVALDMSTSPGMAIVDRSDPDNPRYHLLGFAQTDKQQTAFDQISSQANTPGRILTTIPPSHPTPLFPPTYRPKSKKQTKSSDKGDEKRGGNGYSGGGWECALEVRRSPKEGEYSNNTEFYEWITSRLMERIMGVRDRGCLVVIEAYAFHIAHSSSITKLAELGGVMRNKLWRAGIPFLEVSPTSIKKWFAGKGSADKPEMWKRFQEAAPQIKLAEWLPAAISDTKIPSPHQDIVDAFASAHSLHSNHPYTQPKPKPKHNPK